MSFHIHIDLFVLIRRDAIIKASAFSNSDSVSKLATTYVTTERVHQQVLGLLSVVPIKKVTEDPKV